ncbi:MAG: PEP-CTERM sorting domain-containing protein [Verrucomicrobia bacterium]|nr:PEP-CTERM sorting domain-containing protein [Verrucomicrobiota bacterium]
MSRKLAFVLAAVLVLGVCSLGMAQTSYISKVLQGPDMDSGWNLQSQWDLIDGEPNIIRADNWECPDGRPITDIHWWGSYLFNTGDSNPVQKFEVSIFSDAGGSPGALMWRKSFDSALVNETPVGLDANLEQVYKYSVYLEQEDVFQQNQGEVYWLSIVALTEGTTRWPMWGWHTAVNRNIEDLLQGSAQTTKDPTQNDPFGIGKVENPWQDAQYDMAFELTTIPEPSIVALIGLGLFATWTRFRRR